MQAWLCEKTEGVDSLRWGSLELPALEPGYVRVAIRAASLNFPDLLTVEGKYQIKPSLPFAPGAEFSGVVEAIGPGVQHLQVGQRVAVIGSHGGFATHANAPAAQCLPIPDAMPFEHACCWAFTYGTNHHALIDRGQLKAGETVLVLGAAGGIGTSAVQVAKAAGARVIATASTAEKARFLEGLGADAVIDLSSQDLRTRLKELTGGTGPHVVLDPVGGDVAEAAFRSLAWRGRYLVVGFAAGSIPALPWNLALLKGASLVGVFWGDFLRREPKAFAQSLRELAQWYAQGLLVPVIDRQLPMTELPQAYAAMASRALKGKVVLVNA